ncbi:hypothetical protein K413DRAFT_4804 [Clostridium sp. ASBs410]|nr:hypothetical protein K413DRAFT_4804 [Clostridium sp. ASBs410]
MTHIYDSNETYLYEIIEDYKEAVSAEEKDKIFKSFCSSIWSSNNKRRIYTKSIKFSIRKDLLETDLRQAFNTWSSVDYKYYKSMTKDENWYSIIRQKINNFYTRYFDKEIILSKDYMELLKTPKHLYFQWIDGINGIDAESVTSTIDNTIQEAIDLKEKLQKQKMELSWKNYKELIEGFLRRCFNNCKLIGEYENKTKLLSRFDFITEDNFYVRYINRSLDSYIKNYQKDYYGVRRGHGNKYKRCKICGSLIEKTNNRTLYCDQCKIVKQKEWDLKYKRKIRSKFIV